MTGAHGREKRRQQVSVLLGSVVDRRSQMGQRPEEGSHGTYQGACLLLFSGKWKLLSILEAEGEVVVDREGWRSTMRRETSAAWVRPGGGRMVTLERRRVGLGR